MTSIILDGTDIWREVRWGTPLREHLSGKHDQRAHGRKGSLSAPDHMDGLHPNAVAAIHARAASMGIDSAAMTQRMTDLYLKATPAQLEAGMGWYQKVGDHGEAIGRPYGISRERTSAVYAALSPARSWENNMRVGDSILHVVGKDEPFHADPTLAASARPPFGGGRVRPSQLTPAQLAWTHPEFRGAAASSINHYRQVSTGIELARGDITPDMALTGPKTRSFHNNIFDPRDASSVTIDDWMYRTALGPDTTLTISGAQHRTGDFDYGQMGAVMTRSPAVASAGYPSGSGLYPLFGDAITVGAHSVGVLPHQFQAVVWVVARDGGIQ